MLISDFSKLEELLDPVKIYNLYNFKPISGFSIDSRTVKNGQAFIAIKGKLRDGHDFIKEAVKNGASCIISQKDKKFRCNVPFYVVDDTYKALRDTCRFVREKKNPVVYAITGSVGKTTAKEMLFYLLRGYFSVLKNYKTENNILGIAKTIFSLQDEKILILELGTNNPGEIKELSAIARPDIGIITFVKPVHLKGLKSLPGIFREKISIASSNPAMKMVINKDDNYLSKFNLKRKVYWFGKESACHLPARLIKSNAEKSTFILQDKFQLTLQSGFEGFIYNALAALLGASLLKLPMDKLTKKLCRFSDFPSQRMQIEKKSGFLFLNDAYNSNPYAFCEALKLVEKFSSKKVAIVADMLELGDKSRYYHEKLAQPLKNAGFDCVLTFGKQCLYLKRTLDKIGYKNAYHFSSHAAMVDFVNKKVEKGSLIFLKGSRAMRLEKVVESLS
ncbi:MAG: UDP-N-acetylmuramoyl-tripeptide--D-alanyl-D-alanine ligase [Candidatus Omnitrophota bacterium]